MKKLLVILAAISLLSACHRAPHYSGFHGEKTQIDAEAEFVAALSSEDSTAVLDLAEQFMTLLKDGQTEEAVDMIYVLYNDQLYRKSEAYSQMLVQRFKVFPVYSYHLVYYSFSTQGNNDISYQYAFGRPTSEKPAPTIKLMLNPVLVDGVWYLTLKEQGQSSRDLPKEKQIHDLAPAPDEITLHHK